jgi:uncharacterized protein YndB with AHSA1/START domain
MQTSSVDSDNLKPDLLVVRTVRAPRHLAFDALVKPEHLKRWCGPVGSVASLPNVNLRPGGAFRLSVCTSDGHEHAARGLVREMLVPERLTLTWAWEQHGDQATIGPQTLITFTLTESGGSTELTVRHAGFPDAYQARQHQQGWEQALDRFAGYVAALPSRD